MPVTCQLLSEHVAHPLMRKVAAAEAAAPAAEAQPQLWNCGPSPGAVAPGWGPLAPSTPPARAPCAGLCRAAAGYCKFRWWKGWCELAAVLPSCAVQGVASRPLSQS